MAWPATTFDNKLPLRITAAPVSSQLDSIAKMRVSVTFYAVFCRDFAEWSAKYRYFASKNIKE
jgi:hypothetical protein